MTSLSSPSAACCPEHCDGEEEKKESELEEIKEAVSCPASASGERSSDRKRRVVRGTEGGGTDSGEGGAMFGQVGVG